MGRPKAEKQCDADRIDDERGGGQRTAPRARRRRRAAPSTAGRSVREGGRCPVSRASRQVFGDNDFLCRHGSAVRPPLARAGAADGEPRALRRSTACARGPAARSTLRNSSPMPPITSKERRDSAPGTLPVVTTSSRPGEVRTGLATAGAPSVREIGNRLDLGVLMGERHDLVPGHRRQGAARHIVGRGASRRCRTRRCVTKLPV